MATALDDHQFELLREDADSGVAFGIGRDIHVDAAGFDPGTNDWLVQDQEDPFSGSTRMGRDVQTGSTFTWSMHTNQTDEATALQAIEDLQDMWTPDSLDGAEVMVIRYRVAGRTRRVYGRPRRFAAPPDNKILSGMVPITADFKRVSPLFYDDQPESMSLGVEYTSEGGFVFPVTFPVLTLPAGNYAHWWVSGPTDINNWTAPDYTDIPTSRLQVGDRFLYPTSHDKFTWNGTTWNYDGTTGDDGVAGQPIAMSTGPGNAFVSGRRRTWPIIRLEGPLVDPVVSTANWTLATTLTLNEGHYVEIDTRPWRRTILLDGVSAIPGALTAKTRLRDLFLEPGQQSFGFQGTSGTGTGRCIIKWYPAYPSL